MKIIGFADSIESHIHLASSYSDDQTAWIKHNSSSMVNIEIKFESNQASNNFPAEWLQSGAARKSMGSFR